MKISISLFIALSLLISFVFSCSQPEVPNDAAKGKDDADVNKSEIALREEELGVTYFKRNITITDKTGQNKVVMQFAALDESVLNDYLANVEYQIIPVFKNKNEEETIKPKSSITSENPNKLKSEYAVITEEVSRQLQKGVIGIWVNVRTNQKNNTRTNVTYNYSASHVSSDWPERLHFTIINKGDYRVFNGLHYFVKKKNGGLFASWKTPDTIDRISPNPGTVNNNIFYEYAFAPYGVDYVYEMDGPKKVELFVDYNYVGEYNFSFEQL